MAFDYQAIETTFLTYIFPILVFFGIAYLVHRLASPIAKRLRPLGDITMRDNPRRYERMKTLQVLVSSMVSFLAFVVAMLVSMTLFVNADTLIWMVGLFSAAFGLGARPFISDILTGVTFIFEDTFDVGDKIEVPISPQSVEGVVEKVSLRVTQIRGLDGELYTMPNGDIRVVRNFSRGDSSHTRVTIRVPAAQLENALTHLTELGERSMMLLPNLIEPWQIISETGEIGEDAELTILARTKFGKAAELRVRLMSLLQQELSSVKILPSPTNNAIITADD